jgi:hypothetical protein
MEHGVKYYSLRFRTNDALHKRGDKLNCADNSLYIGQTPECEFCLPQHPEYVDTCYAVIIRNGNGWDIIRQEQNATIIINNQPLGIVHHLQNNDRITFDKTEVQFSISDGAPDAKYVNRRSIGALWAMLVLFGCIIIGIIGYIMQIHKSPMEIFSEELSSIYIIKVDSIYIYRAKSDTSCIQLSRASIGTGFVTDDGHFVTARHCIEPWLAMESELRDDFNQITSEIVKYAILAEEDTTIRLVSKITIMSEDEKRQWQCTSEDFFMDKEQDNIYELGNINRTYFWRTLTSHYDDKESMLGDLAVMRWSDDKPQGHISLANDTLLISQDLSQPTLYGFGFPPNHYNRDTMPHIQDAETSISFIPRHPDDFLICNYKFDAGYSGGPIFMKNWTNTTKSVVGIISWADDQKTLIVPVSQINKLIKRLN